jgi:N-methylhydantoinase B/oxoprolinase/acetone carboxylase alpha subunit
MDGTVWRSSRSTIVRETLGYSSAIYDRDGFNVAQSVHIPQHLNSMGYALRRIVDHFIPLADWQDGDVVIASDPYCGGQHLPDILAFRPVFHEGARVAIVGTLCHHLDVAGMSPGGSTATATEIYQEGLRIPPLRLYRAGRRNDEVWATPSAACRTASTPSRISSTRRICPGRARAHAGCLSRMQLCLQFPDGDRRSAPQRPGRDRDRWLRRPARRGRGERLQLRHAQQCEHPA